MSGPSAALLNDEDALKLILPAMRSDYKAVGPYVTSPEVQVNCPVTVLIGESDERVTLDEALAWERHTTNKFELVKFPGGHFGT